MEYVVITPILMGRRFNINEVFSDIRKWIFDIKNSIFCYQKIVFNKLEIWILDKKKIRFILWYQQIDFVISKKNSFKSFFFLYQKLILWYEKFKLSLISRIIFSNIRNSNNMVNKYHIFNKYSLDSKLNCWTTKPDLHFDSCWFSFEELYNVRI